MAHLLWLLVLVKLILPPAVYIDVPIRFVEFSSWGDSEVEQIPGSGDPVQKCLDSIDSHDVFVDGFPREESTPKTNVGATHKLRLADETYSSEQGVTIGSGGFPDALSAATTSPSWESMILTVWMAGSCLWILLVAHRIRAFSRLIKQTLPAGDQE